MRSMCSQPFSCTTFSSLLSPKNFGGMLFLFQLFCPPNLCPAMELEPRRWNHLPLSANFAGAGYSTTEADIYFDPVLKIEDAELEMHTWIAKYIRTFELLQKSARIDVILGYQDGRWNGLLGGEPASISRSGLMDSILRFAVNLYGAPPLRGKAFQEYRRERETETIIGSALAIHFPTGNYMDDKLINLGSNRYTFRPQVGIVHTRKQWSMELTGSVWLYTDNTDFYNGNTLGQSPLGTLQAHLIYTFRPGVWISGSFGYSYGGESTVNEQPKNDRRQNLAWLLSFGYPITRSLGAKIVYLGIRSQEPVGQDSDTLGLAFSFYW